MRQWLLAAAVSAACAPAAWAQATAAQPKPLPMLANAVMAGRVTTSVLPTAPCGRVEVAPVVQVSAGKSTVLRPSVPITRVLLGNPEGSRAARPTLAAGKDEKNGMATANMTEDKMRPGVAEVDVLLLSPTEVYVLGKAIGTTNVVLLDERGQCTAFDVVVNMDTAALQTVIGQLMPNETGVRVSSAFDSIVLTGSVSDAGALMRVTDLSNAFVRSAGGGTGGSVAGSNPRIVNMLSTGAPQQVMLEVKVAEVSKALLDRFGIDFSRAWVPGDGSMVRFLSGIFGGAAAAFGQIGGTGPGGVPFSSVDAVVGGTVPIPGTSGGNVTVTYDNNNRPTYTTTYGTVPGRTVTNGAANMQKTDGLVKVLAEPTVMAISGQKGSFNAGGKIFIPVSQESGTGGRTVTLEEKEFGVSVGFLPTVLDGGRINLEVATEVSELNRDGVGISAPGVSGIAILPSFTSRRAKTTVQLVDGQSFAIGGLIKNNNTASVRAFPVLGELPIIGALFRSTEFQTDKSELVFVITPRLVKPLPAGYALPTDNYVPPTRSDVHLYGRTEGQRPEPAPAVPDSAAPAPAGASAPSGGFQVK